MRIESQKVAKGLDGNDGAGDCILLWDNGLEKQSQRVPPTATQVGEEFSVIEEIPPEDLWYAKNEMTVWYSLEHFFTEPFPEFHHPFLVTRWTEMAALAGECQEILVPAVSTFDPREAIMKDATIKIAI